MPWRFWPKECMGRKVAHSFFLNAWRLFIWAYCLLHLLAIMATCYHQAQMRQINIRALSSWPCKIIIATPPIKVGVGHQSMHQRGKRSACQYLAISVLVVYITDCSDLTNVKCILSNSPTLKPVTVN